MFVFSLHYVLNFNDVLPIPMHHVLVLVALLSPRFDYNVFNDMGSIRSHFFIIQPLCDCST